MGGCSTKDGAGCLKGSREIAEECRRQTSFSMSSCCLLSSETPPDDVPPVNPWEPMDEDEYVTYLQNAKYRSDHRFQANRCPKTKLEDFKVTGYIGGGNFGAVYCVESLQSGAEFALKIQMKKNIKNLRLDVVREKKLHFAVENKFIVRLLSTSQDSKNLYMLMERAVYGDLSKLSNLGEDMIKSIVAQVVLALEYLHACSIIHRDLKPENVLLAGDFYVKLTDFGIAKRIRRGRTSSFVGCLPYLSPEHHLSLAYGRDFDFWLLGLFIFELSYKIRAFYKPGWSEEKCKEAVLKTEVPFPNGVGENSAKSELIKALLEKKRRSRLGTLQGGINDVKQHEWFSGINFQRLFNKEERKNLFVEPVAVVACAGFKDIIGTPVRKDKRFKGF